MSNNELNKTRLLLLGYLRNACGHAEKYDDSGNLKDAIESIIWDVEHEEEDGE